LALSGHGGTAHSITSSARQLSRQHRLRGWRRAEIVPHSGTPARGKSAIAKIAAIKSL
jgi:hypothetical protein